MAGPVLARSSSCSDSSARASQPGESARARRQQPQPKRRRSLAGRTRRVPSHRWGPAESLWGAESMSELIGESGRRPYCGIHPTEPSYEELAALFVELAAQLERANGRVEALETEVAALRARLGGDSTNSSAPSSADPPTTPASRLSAARAGIRTAPAGGSGTLPWRRTAGFAPTWSLPATMASEPSQPSTMHWLASPDSPSPLPPDSRCPVPVNGYCAGEHQGGR